MVEISGGTASWGVFAASEHHLNTLSLRDYFNVVRRRKWTVGYVSGLVIVSVLIFSLSQWPLYRASAEVVITQQALPAGVTDGSSLPPAQEDPDRFAVTQARLARTSGVLRATLAAMRLRMPVAQLRAESSVSAAPDSDF